MYSIGLDISKSTIDIYIPINNSNHKIDNNGKSIKSFYLKLKKLYKKDIENIVFVFEPTGSYSNLLKKFCSEKNIKCFIVNPKQSANFSKAIGQRNKSDIEDAVMLSKMIVTAVEKEIKVPVINPYVEQLHEAIAYYKLLLKQRVQLKNHFEAIKVNDTDSFIVDSVKAQIKSLTEQIDKLILSMKNIISNDEKLLQSYNNIQSIKGVGDISTIVLLHHFIKYPNANQREIISLSGLDPISKTSGTSINSKAKISKAGSKLCRGTLFMTTMVAVRFNDEFKTFYENLKQRGKHTSIAQIAVMRKIILIAHSLYKKNELYNSLKYLENKM